jgi:type IV secretory pathway VirB2 component (pilin)
MKNSDLKLLFLLLLLAAAAPVFAQDIMPPGMTNLANSIMAIFTGPFVRTILIIFFCATAVTYAFNKDNEKMKRNCIAIGIGIGLLVAASSIVERIWDAAAG